MFTFISFLFIIFVFLYLHYKYFKIDLTLKIYEIFGKNVEQLKGKVVWITGASSGIGEHLAYELARVGCKLVLSARRQQELERVKRKCCELSVNLTDFDGDSDILVLPLDTTKFESHEEAFTIILNHFGQVDILVNNSGRSQRALAVDTELQVDRELFDLNVIGSISLTKTVLHHMIKNKTGHVVVVSSVQGKFGVVGSATYSASKFALQGYFSSLRAELYDKGIKVTSICPGPIKTASVQNAVTETHGTSYKDKKIKENVSGRMEAGMFARYMAIAIVNELDECWISPQPVLLITYASQYLPSIFNTLYKRFAIKGLKKLRETEEKKSD
ncbi:dehydrogenase/reductase SDR family member 7-like isoform X1 [Xenia sp. Carnegie-2017]|uniref:dehydrogenase/reductase SDR family member 7-like isoform X1 n=1 Tax=Xenia sp. Carnegie-2017 TaxID=2897299 RepID=UPI001F04719C|nr:dehydrogenase/reductase SDR family member 7-like isoform X1 [Xenia sp. Carnegie-2017]